MEQAVPVLGEGEAWAAGWYWVSHDRFQGVLGVQRRGV